MNFIEITEKMCAITKQAVNDHNTLSEKEFMNKYACSKKTYARRVEKYEDPYMNAPLAKFGKFLNAMFRR